MQYLKSPMNYIGNKYRTIGQMHKWFPRRIGTMVDLFCGGCDVSINTAAQRRIANDLNFYVVNIMKAFQELGREKTLGYIDDTIARWGLSEENQEAYEAFRAYYNRTRRPMDLYILMCFSFNYQFRFNAAHEYNNPFGRARSSFNGTMRNNLIRLFDVIGEIRFTSCDFREFDYGCLKSGDFLYADPPYLITCGSYNDGKRGFKGWGERDERDLYAVLDSLHGRGVRFALSNVSHHKGARNEILLRWKTENRYHMHTIQFNYDNCNYQAKNRENRTKEVLITNY